MASYQEHMAKQQARQANSNLENVKVHFINEFLANDGDTAIIRFPYKSMNDIIYTATHNVVMAGAPFGRRIRCTETPECPLCAQGIKVDERVFIKFLVYTVEDGNVVLNNTVWDRPSAFADIEIKGLIEEYGDLSNVLFKIKRSGSGKQTRYTMLPVVNAAVYNPAVYKADFSDLNKIDAEKVLSKSIEQYNAILNPEAAQPKTQPTVDMPYPQPTAPATQPVYQEPVQNVAEPVQVVQTPVTPVESVSTEAVSTPDRTFKKYTF